MWCKKPCSWSDLQNPTVNDGADGASTQSGGQTVEQTRLAINLADVFGWNTHTHADQRTAIIDM